MSGTLYLCATPIGNLDDMTFRVLDTLKQVDLIAAEDTRNSIKLLNHFDIHTEMTSYHEYNKYEKAQYLIEQMQQGKDVALITDAGTPAISDPGEVLVAECHKAGVPVTSLPGPAACITALTLSGLSTRRFCFEGFLPSSDDKKARKRILEDLKTESRTIILYEAPHHLRAVLDDLYETLGDRKISICRELTKKFEEVNVTTLEQAIFFYKENEPRGEYVLVLEGRPEEDIPEDMIKDLAPADIRKRVEEYEASGMEHMEAMKKVAADLCTSKREIYARLLDDRDKQSRI